MLHEAEDSNCFFLTGSDKCFKNIYELIIKKFDDTKQDYTLKDILIENKQEFDSYTYVTRHTPLRTKKYGHCKLIVGKAYLVLGFIRFLKGYYIVLVTKRKRVAKIMRHSIYTIKDMKLVPLFNKTNDEN
jgi:hypothetical protein